MLNIGIENSLEATTTYSDNPVRWRPHGVSVLPVDSPDSSTTQMPGISHAAAINFAHVDAEEVWADTVAIHPRP